MVARPSFALWLLWSVIILLLATQGFRALIAVLEALE